ncbi:MAG: DUF4936 family protein [Thiobacillus sp.]|nr:DUF4936 family protein [Thiobacillus sp.]
MQHLYVYYRVDLSQASLAATQIDRLLDAMAPHCGQQPRRLVRCDDPSTWMEVYEGVARREPFLRALQTAVETFGCNAFALGSRHLECFDDASA